MREVDLLDGVLMLPIRSHQDNRGQSEAVDIPRTVLSQYLPTTVFSVTNQAAGILRGLHIQIEHAPQAKLIWCSTGSIFDVLVDARPNSPTLGKWMRRELNSTSREALFVPPLIAHGYQTLSPRVVVHYVLFGITDPELERVIRWDDETLDIPWPRPAVRISKRDLEGQAWMTFVSS